MSRRKRGDLASCARLETFYIHFWARIRPGWEQGWPGGLPDGYIPPCSRWYSKNITRSQAEQLLKQEVSADCQVWVFYTQDFCRLLLPHI